MSVFFFFRVRSGRFLVRWQTMDRLTLTFSLSVLSFYFLSQFAFAQNKCYFGSEKNGTNILEYRTCLTSLEYPLCYYMMANVSSDKSRGCDRDVGLCTNYGVKDGECLDGMGFCCCKGNLCNCKDKEEQNQKCREPVMFDDANSYTPHLLITVLGLAVFSAIQ